MRLIDADALKKELEFWVLSEFYRHILLEHIDNAPTVEPKKGEWIEEPGKIPHCSICGTYSDDADREDGGFYCTHCGADMRGD